MIDMLALNLARRRPTSTRTVFASICGPRRWGRSRSCAAMPDLTSAHFGPFECRASSVVFQFARPHGYYLPLLSNRAYAYISLTRLPKLQSENHSHSLSLLMSPCANHQT